jgi:hypothetical protein
MRIGLDHSSEVLEAQRGEEVGNVSKGIGISDAAMWDM